MKISRIRPGILFVFIVFILIEIVSFATYRTVVLGQIEENKISAMKTRIKEEDITLSSDEQRTLDLINEYRVQNGLSELKPFSDLQRVAKIKAEDLVNNEYFAHNSPVLGTPFEMLKNNGVSYSIAGENLAGFMTPEKAVEGWINSPTHRDNILEERFEYTGIYIIESDVYGKVFVQLFIGLDN